MRLMDASTKQIVDLNSMPDSNQAIQAVLNGQAVADANSTYDLKSIEGKPYQVSGQDLSNALATGSTFFTKQDAAAANEKTMFGGVGGQVAAGALGAANGLTLGGAGLALDKTGLVSGDTQAALQRQNPITSTASNVAGAVIPAVLSGGESAIARGLQYTPAGLIGALGKGVSSLAAPVADSIGSIAGGLAPKALSPLAESVISKATQAGLGSAAEGAMYGGGQAVDESVIQNKPLTAEALMMGVGKGGLLGLGLGGALGGGAELLGQGIKAGGEKLSSIIGDNGQKLESGLIARSFGASKKQMGAILGNDFKQAAISDAYKAAVVGVDDSSAIDGSFKTAFDSAKEKPLGLNSVTLSNEEVGNRISALKQKAGDTIDKSLEQVQAVTDSGDFLKQMDVARNDLNTIDFAGKDKVAGYLDKLKNEFSSVNPETGKVSYVDMSAKDLWSLRRQLDDVIYNAKDLTLTGMKVDNSFTQALAKGRRAVESRIEEMIETSGGNAFSEYKAAKKAYAGASDIEKLIAHSDAKNANNIFGLTSYISAGAGAAVGGPIGAAAGLLGRKAIADYGDKAALMVLSQLEKHASSLNKVVDESINGLMKVGNKGAAISPIIYDGIKGDKHESYQQKANGLNEQIQHLDQIKKNLDQSLGHLGAAAPQTAIQLRDKTLNALDFLQSKIPKNPQINPMVHYQVPESEIDKFNRYSQAVEKPQSIMNNLKHGYISPEEVEVLKNVYPELHTALKTKAVDALGKKGKEINYQLRIQLQKLLETKSDVNLYPTSIKTLQQSFSPNSQVNQDQNQQALKPARMPGSRAKSLNLGGSASSGLESTLRRRSN